MLFTTWLFLLFRGKIASLTGISNVFMSSEKKVKYKNYEGGNDLWIL